MSTCHLNRQEFDRSCTASPLVMPDGIQYSIITSPKASDACRCTGLDIFQTTHLEDCKGTQHKDVRQQLLLAKLLVLPADHLNALQISS